MPTAWKVEFQSTDSRGRRIWLPGVVYPAGYCESAEAAITRYQQHIKTTVLAGRADQPMRARAFQPRA